MNQVFNVNLTINGIGPKPGRIKLTRTEVQLYVDEREDEIISLPRISAIQIHQPIFGANYIDIEYDDDNGKQAKAVITFNKGGATEFAQAFFRATEGVVAVDLDHQPGATSNPQGKTLNEKKNN